MFGLEELVIYHGLNEKEGIKLYFNLRNDLAEEKRECLAADYAKLVKVLYDHATPKMVGDLWQNYFLEQIIAEIELNDVPDKFFIAQELSYMQKYFNFNLEKIEVALANVLGKDVSFSYKDLKKEADSLYSPHYETLLKDMKEKLAKAADWSEVAGDLEDFYQNVGTSLFAKYWGFSWHDGKLEGIQKLETMELSYFTGYDDQRKQLFENTEQFVKGFGANNVLLYGDRGTGKSSSIKALFPCFSPQGLRIIEIAKHQLIDFPKIIRLLRDEKEKFIIFIDDLSFEPEETDYKYMKAILEGGLEVQPKNILVYATSNRRHLVREFRSERDMYEELNKRDTMQEKLSLADRFGLTITFSSPTEKEYLQIVEKMAERRGLNLPLVDLHSLALKWQMWHNGLSGRTAKQFIEDLAGKMEM